MYACLCKGLTESDVRKIARDLAGRGVTSVPAFLEYLELDDIGACGHCAEEPEHLIELAEGEWAESGKPGTGNLEHGT
jgi:bacterioferritin-associated ferredoxin